jgi:hypothetical protein
MSEIVYRLVKGRELTFAEIDRNFSSVDSDIGKNRRYVDAELDRLNAARDSDFIDIISSRDSDAAAIILGGIARHDSDISSINGSLDSEHAWNVVEHGTLQNNIDSNFLEIINLESKLDSELNVIDDRFDSLALSISGGIGVEIIQIQSDLDSEHAWNIVEHRALADSIGREHDFNVAEHDILQYNVNQLSSKVDSNSLNINSIVNNIQQIEGDITDLEGSAYTAGSGITISGANVINNTSPDQTVVMTGTGATTITGTYPNFTVNSTDTDNNTTYTAGNGIALTGTQFKMSGSYTGTFTATGDIVAFSDSKLKSDVTAIDQALDKLMAITGYTYNTTENAKRRSGVMAQDVEKVLPEVVHTSEDGTKGVAYGNMMGLVIEAIRELKTQVDDLKVSK